MLKRYFKLVIFTLFVFLLFAPVVRAQTSNRTTQVITIPEGEVIERDFYIQAGEIVEISGRVNGDVIIAGGQLFVDGVIDGDLIGAGGTVNISGEVEEDVRVVGGQVNISGNVGKNITVVGGDVKILDDAELGGGVVAVGGNILLAANIPGEVVIAAGNLTITGEIEEDTQVIVGTLRIASGARLEGDLTYTSEEEALVDDEASISGRLLRKTPPAGVERVEVDEFVRDFTLLRLQTKVVSLLSALIVGLLIVRFLPNYTKSVAEVMEKKVWRSLGIGFLAIVITPVALVILFVTIMGIPLAIFTLFSYLIYLYLAKIFVSFYVGSRISTQKNNLYVPLILGLLVYYLVTLVPILGGMVSLVATLIGFGGMLIACRQYYERAKKSKLI